MEKIRKAAKPSNFISIPPKRFEPGLSKYMSQSLLLQQSE
jgi:hypothetical protein